MGRSDSKFGRLVTGLFTVFSITPLWLNQLFPLGAIVTSAFFVGCTFSGRVKEYKNVGKPIYLVRMSNGGLFIIWLSRYTRNIFYGYFTFLGEINSLWMGIVNIGVFCIWISRVYPKDAKIEDQNVYLIIYNLLQTIIFLVLGFTQQRISIFLKRNIGPIINAIFDYLYYFLTILAALLGISVEYLSVVGLIVMIGILVKQIFITYRKLRAEEEEETNVDTTENKSES